MKKDVNIKGKEYWRSLDQLAETPEFQEFLHREFPENASEMISPVSRRKFLTLMGASIAFAGLAGCRRPVEKIVPYVIAPENIVPGIPMHYATTMPFGLNSYGLVVENHEGRPTKIEGNKKHPSSLGSSNAFIQSEMLNLYDPDRSQSVRMKGVEKEWTEFVAFWREMYPAFLATGGKGLAIVSGAFSSPSIYGLYEKFIQKFPEAEWAVYEPVSDENIFNGIRMASGKTVRPVYHFERAKVILSLDADFLLMENESIKANKGFAAGRRVESEKDGMNRLYVAESVFTVTGGMADHRLRLQSSLIPAFTMAVAEELNRLGLKIDLPFAGAADITRKFDRKWINALAKDLLKNNKQSLIVAGRRQPAIVHSIVYALNYALGSAGNAVTYHELKDASVPSFESFKRVTDKVTAGEIDALIVFGGNPVFDAPSDFDFKSLLKKVKHSVHLSTHVDETSEMTEWHIP
ncbi:MAG: TAT-variant-translocated molybdopterin oxidoreductase, partial [Calditrichaceae bacterium]